MSVRTIQLGEVREFVYGDSLKEERRRPGKVPVFGSNGIVGWHDRPITSGPTIVIGRKGSIGEINWSNEPCFPIDTTYFVEETKQPCDLRWLYFILLKLDLTRLNKSAAIPGLNRDDAYEQTIPWPDLLEQKRIATLLEQVDRLRRTRRYALELNDTFLPAVFLELFGRTNPESANWSQVGLTELCEHEDDIRCGPFGTQLNKSEFRRSGVPLWGIKHVNTGFELETDEFLTEVKSQELDAYSLRPGDLVMTRKGTIGNCAIYPLHFQRGIMHSDLLRIRLRAGVVSPVFLNHQLHFDTAIKRQIDLISGGAIMAGINVGMLKSIRVQLPPMGLQQHFSSLVAKHERLRAGQREALRQVDHLFNSLLDRAFR